MNASKATGLAIVVIVLVIACGARTGFAQNFSWVPTGPEFSLDVTKTFFKDAPEIRALSGTVTLGAAFPISGNTAVRMSIPIGHSEYRGLDDRIHGTSRVGNLYLGAVTGGRRGDYVYGLDVGAYIPTVNKFNDAVMIGAFDNYFDSPESFAQKLLSMKACFANRIESGKVYGVARVGPSFWYYTQKAIGAADRFEFLGHYKLGVGVETQVLAEAGIRGWAMLTQSGNFWDRSFHEVHARVGVPLGQFLPAAEVQVPIDGNMNDVLYATVRVGLTYRL